MITLAIIGVISAIIIPVAIHSKPDENIMKFKKANNTLYQVMQRLVSEDKYYLNGNLGKMPSGENVTSPTYFCENFADILSTKSLNCSSVKTKDYEPASIMNDPEVIGTYADCLCNKYQNAGSEIVSSDGVVFYNVNPKCNFGKRDDDSVTDENYYNYFCIDVDGLNNGIASFGYAIRQDGKIIPGKRAIAYLDKDLTSENEDNYTTPATCKAPTCTGLFGNNCVECNKSKCLLRGYPCPVGAIYSNCTSCDESYKYDDLQPRCLTCEQGYKKVFIVDGDGADSPEDYDDDDYYICEPE